VHEAGSASSEISDLLELSLDPKMARTAIMSDMLLFIATKVMDAATLHMMERSSQRCISGDVLVQVSRSSRLEAAARWWI
jgi:hypothetical protein